MGGYAKAEQLYRTSLKTRQQKLSKNNLLVATTMFQLAWVLAEQNKFAEAESLFREVVTVRSSLLESDHRDIGIAQAGLLIVLLAMNKDTEALLLALAEFKASELITVFSAYQSGRRQRQQRKYEEAEQSYHTVLDTAQQILGERHPIVVYLLGDFAGLLREKGDHLQAELKAQEALKIGREVLGAHPKLVQPMIDLARVLASKGRFDEAKELFREAIVIAERRFPDNYGDQARFLQQFADVLRGKGEFEKAEEACREALDFGPDEIDPGDFRRLSGDLVFILLEKGESSDSS